MASSLFIYKSWGNTQRTFGTDLRNRIVGARLLDDTPLIYEYKWNNGDDQKLCDPYDHPNDPMNRITASPLLIKFHQIFRSIEYKETRSVWFFIQYLLLIGSCIFLLLTFKETVHQRVIILAFFTIPMFELWQFHIERGQVYILYAFLISILVYSLNLKKQGLSILLISLLIILRPTFLLLIFLPVIQKKWKQVSWILISIICLFIIHLSIIDLDTYFNWFEKMNQYGNLQIAQLPIFDREHLVQYPKVIEGYKNLMEIGGFDIENSSIQYLFQDYFQIKIQPKNLKLFFLLSGTITILIGYLKKLDLAKSVLLILGLIILSEWFIPAPRFSYSLIQYIGILSILRFYILDSKIKIGLGTSLIIISPIFEFIPFHQMIGEIAILVILFTIVLSKDYEATGSPFNHHGFNRLSE